MISQLYFLSSFNIPFIAFISTRPSAVNRLQMYRKLKRISQSILAKESGVNLRTLQQYEIGAKDIHKASVTTFQSLCMVLKCDIKDLL